LLDEAGRDHPFDAQLILTSATDQARALSAIRGDTAVRRVESWATKGAIPARRDGQYIVHTYPDGGHGALTVRGVPQQSSFFAHRMLVGHWLDEGDGTGVVLNQIAHAMFFPNSKPGDTISLAIPGHSTRLELRGVASEAIAPPSAFVTRTSYMTLTGEDEASTNLTLAFQLRTDVDGQSKALSRRLEQAGVPVAAIVTEAMVRRGQGAHFYILIFVLLVISVAMALVGVLGLASALSTNVVERTREFGIMRAIGASRRAVLESVVGEALFTASASYLIAIPASLLFALALDELLGRLMFQTLHLTVSPLGMGLWLLAVLLGAAVASVVPALRAARLTVHQALAIV
jgi:putative ABC transport system permease protein